MSAEPRTDGGRRGAIRTLLGGSALAAVAGSAALGVSAAGAQAEPAGAAADPFALEQFRPSGRVREYWIQAVGTWPYHDHSVPQSIAAPGAAQPKAGGTAMGAKGVMEIGAEVGLFGILAITDERTPRVDREFVLFFHDLYQADVPSVAQDIDMFNGGAFIDNTPTFTARVGERVRWRIAALGKEFHVFHLHGHRWRSNQGDRGGWIHS